MTPYDVLVVKERVYDRCNLIMTDLFTEVESTEYGACTFRLNGMQVIHRSSKITPTKIGQFVTLWKRNAQRETTPFDMSDDFDFIVITAKRGLTIGQFVFSKTVLIEHGVISAKNKGGKRGFRIYPHWDKTTNKQAEKSQRWQLPFFFELKENDLTDLTFVKSLFAKRASQSFLN